MTEQLHEISNSGNPPRGHNNNGGKIYKPGQVAGLGDSPQTMHALEAFNTMPEWKQQQIISYFENPSARAGAVGQVR